MSYNSRRDVGFVATVGNVCGTVDSRDHNLQKSRGRPAAKKRLMPRHETHAGGANIGIVAQKGRAEFFQGRQSQGFRTEWHAGIFAGLKKAIALAVWFTVNNGADTANNVPITPDTVPTSQV